MGTTGLKRFLTAALTVLMVASFATTPAMSAERDTSKTELFYIAVAHPDDETTGRSYLEQLPKETYTVFVLMTRGDATDSCLPPEQAHINPGSDALAPTDFGTFGRNLLGLPTSTPEDSSGPFK